MRDSQSTDSKTLPVWLQGIQGQVALVTGAGRGLGRAAALALSHAGARVIAVSRTTAELRSLAEEAPGAVEVWTEDATGDALLARIEGLERLDVLVNNAGTNQPQPFLEVTDEALDEMLNLNLRAAFRVARSAARAMARGAGGCIINVSSQMGHVGSPRRTVYCMTKHGIEGLTKAMAVELARMGIRVNSIAPTFVDTPLTRPFFDDREFADFVMSMIPMKRLGTLDEVAAAVVYLASPAAGIITGTSLRLDGGWTAQ